MRFSSCSESPNSTAARRRVTYLSSCVFMSRTSRGQKDHAVFFHCQDHGFINVDIPAVADTHAYGIAAVLHQLSPQRHFDVAQSHSKNHRAPNPNLKRTYHPFHPLRTPPSREENRSHKSRTTSH